MTTDSASPAPAPGRRRLTTVRQVCQEYLDRNISTQQRPHWLEIRKTIAHFIAAKGDVSLDDLITDDLEKFIDDHPGWKSEWTKWRVAGSIKRAFSWGWHKGLIDRMPFRDVRYRQGARGAPLSEEHFRMFLRDSSAEFRRVLLFLWWTGARPGEMSALQWTMIDVEKCVAVLHDHKTAHSRKDRLPRTICLPAQAIRLLTWILADQRTDQPYVFLNLRGRPWTKNSLGLRIARLRKRLGIPPSVKLYGCRRSFGTRMAMAGVELKTLSTLMGHTTVRMSEHYIFMAAETEHLHESLERGLAGKKGKPGEKGTP